MRSQVALAGSNLPSLSACDLLWGDGVECIVSTSVFGFDGELLAGEDMDNERLRDVCCLRISFSVVAR
jgi:hypothetical protein